jgi:hypothetical protein
MDPDTDPDPDTDSDSLEMLDPDPDSINQNPKHCLEVKYCKKKSQIIFLSEYLPQQEKQSCVNPREEYIFLDLHTTSAK